MFNRLQKFRIKHKPDYILALLVFILVAFGLIMISSSSIIKSYEITNGSSNYYYLIRQLINVGIGIFIWIVCQSIDYSFWKRYAVWFLLISLFLTVLVFVPHIGISLGGSQRWIGYGTVMFQPSELLKLSFIIFLAWYFDKIGEATKTFFYGFLPFIMLLAVIFGTLMLQPDMGTAMVFLAIGLVMYFIAGANLVYIISLIPIIAIGIWALIKTAPYRFNRLAAFLNPKSDVLGIGYHINQSLIAIGSGGFWGLGYGNSIQKYNYLPEPMTDSIFAIIAEELGFIRSFLVIVIFGLIAWRGFQIAQKTEDRFGKYLATGITVWILVQAFINLAAMLKLIPLTGVPLPFISYGGSSLLVLLAAVGILLNISKQTK